MAIYTFRRDDNLAGFHSRKQLGTDVLNSLGALRAAGHALEYDPDLMVESEDEGGELVTLDVRSGTQESDWHSRRGVGDEFSRHGVRITGFGASVS